MKDLKEIANKLGYTREDFIHKRVYKVKIYRYALMKKYRDDGMTLVEIGNIFGCSHATVICALRSLDNLVIYPYTKQLIKEVYEA